MSTPCSWALPLKIQLLLIASLQLYPQQQGWHNTSSPPHSFTLVRTKIQPFAQPVSLECHAQGTQDFVIVSYPVASRRHRRCVHLKMVVSINAHPRVPTKDCSSNETRFDSDHARQFRDKDENLRSAVNEMQYPAARALQFLVAFF